MNMNELIYHKISKSDFIKLNENNLMFITNPGRMGDEDGTTFIIKNNHELTIYRIDGWMYPNEKTSHISMNDTVEQFPKWFDTWKCGKDKGKYKYLYMGFGNGLSIDNSIYDEYKPYLDEAVNNYLFPYSKKDRINLQYAAIYNVWESAVINMANHKGYTIKKR